MATLTAVRSGPKGAVLGAGASATATTGDKVPVGNTIAVVENGSGGAITVNVTTPATDKYGGAVADITSASIPNGQAAAFGPFDPDLGDADGLVTLICSAVSSVKIFTISVP